MFPACAVRLDEGWWTTGEILFSCAALSAWRRWSLSLAIEASSPKINLGPAHIHDGQTRTRLHHPAANLKRRRHASGISPLIDAHET
jgi:hypothetical protein